MGTVVTYTVYIEPSTQNEDSEPINHLHMMLMMMTQNEDSETKPFAYDADNGMRTVNLL